MSDIDLKVERKGGSGHYVVSAFVVDEDDFEFLHSVSFWGYDRDEYDSHKDMMNDIKASYVESLKREKLVLS